MFFFQRYIIQKDEIFLFTPASKVDITAMKAVPLCCLVGSVCPADHDTT